MRRTLLWGVCASLSAGTLVMLALYLAEPGQSESGWELVANAAWVVVGVGCPVLAGLILSRQPRNVIGWLLLSLAFTIVTSIAAETYWGPAPAAPAHPTLPLLLFIWFTSWSWLLLVFPIVLIPLFFPTGRPPGPRWWWVAAALAGEALFFIFIATFTVELQPAVDNVAWSVPNPIGFLTDEMVEAVIGPWVPILGVLVLLSVASLFVRYRRAGVVVRTQIRWLLYACGLFALVYVSAIIVPTETAAGGPTAFGNLWNLAFALSLVAVPAAIGIAILRYRLWDIDVIIRRTLIYSVVTGVVALIYFGSVVVSEPLLRRFTGQGTQLASVLSTLVIAALFAPVRRRAQAAVDRRFYRVKYNAARTLAAFAATARDEVELDRLSEQLVAVVAETIQPARVSLWLNSAASEAARRRT